MTYLWDVKNSEEITRFLEHDDSLFTNDRLAATQHHQSESFHCMKCGTVPVYLCTGSTYHLLTHHLTLHTHTQAPVYRYDPAAQITFSLTTSICMQEKRLHTISLQHDFKYFVMARQQLIRQKTRVVERQHLSWQMTSHHLAAAASLS